MEIVKLISSGTSDSVTAHSTYLSGESVILDVVLGVTAFADAVAIRCQHVPSGDPFAADVTAAGMMDIGAVTMRTNHTFLIGRRIQAMTFDDALCLLKQRTAFNADQHEPSPSGIVTYYPQSQPSPSRKSLQGHLLSGFFSYLQGQ